jgi:hypothetical protein
MKNPIIIFNLLFLLTISCSKRENTIIEIDTDKIILEASKDGLTEDESEKLNIVLYDSIMKNTIGKNIPNIIMYDIANQKKSILTELDKIDSDFILVSSDLYCGYGTECITDVFPKSYKKFSQEHGHILVICLIKRTEDDINDSGTIKKTIDNIKPFYNSIYIIDEKEASKLNMYANPSRLYVTKDLVVKNIKFGMDLSGDLYEEIKQNIKLN